MEFDRFEEFLNSLSGDKIYYEKDKQILYLV